VILKKGEKRPIIGLQGIQDIVIGRKKAAQFSKRLHIITVIRLPLKRAAV
jgi:hypothetical protein